MSEVSTRDRKRHSTAVQIHSIAKEIALRSTPAEVKIDEVARAANISRRTFFNYFATKEDAILGFQAPVVTDEALAAFESSEETLLLRATQLIIDVYKTIAVEGTSIKARVELKNHFPELKLRMDHYVLTTEQLVRPVIEARVQKEDAEVILRFTGAILRYTYAHDPDLAKESVKQSVLTFLETIKRIA